MLGERGGVMRVCAVGIGDSREWDGSDLFWGSLESDLVGMEGGGHDSRDEGGVAFHERAGGGFVGSFEDDETESLVAGLEGAAGEEDFAFGGGSLEVREMRADGFLVGVGPGGVVVEPRHEFEHVDELPGLGRGRRGLLLVGGEDRREDGEEQHEREAERCIHDVDAEPLFIPCGGRRSG